MNVKTYLLLAIAFAFLFVSCSTDSTPVYQLTTHAEPSEGGTVNLSAAQAEQGQSITITAVPNEHWVFSGWAGDHTGSQNPASVVMDRDKSVRAMFVKRDYPLTITIEGEGTVTEEVIQAKTTDYPHGTRVRLTALAEEGWTFIKWDGDVEDEEEMITVTVNGPVVLSALFEKIGRDKDTAVVEVTSPTGRIWMDRNLGASRRATSSTDSQAYGDLYQWGRGADGHQKRNSSMTSTLSNTDRPVHGSFILAPNNPSDWRSPQNRNLWQGVNGTNNPCPSGFRLPTDAEWNAERQSWISDNAAGAFASPLRLPVAGARDFSSGAVFIVGSFGHYWSRDRMLTVSGTGSRNLCFGRRDAGMCGLDRATGYSVRCIKD